MTNRLQKTSLLIVISALLLVLLVGCGGPSTPAATPTLLATAIPPTSTSAPAELLRITAQSNTADPVARTLTDFTTANSLQYRTLTALTAADITSGTKIIVIDGAPADLSALAGAAPTTQFILLGAANPDKLANVSVVQASADDEAFMAGYLTMLISQDWRAGALLTSDGAIGTVYADDFTNGAEYVCGKCNPYYAPVVNFPVISSEASASAADTWTNDAATIGKDRLSAVFVTPSAASTNVVNALTAQNVNATLNGDSIYLISTTAAPQDGSIAWSALLDTNYAAALTQLLPQALKGQGNLNVKAQIGLTAINEDIVTPAKQNLFNQVAADLAADKIIPTTIQ